MSKLEKQVELRQVIILRGLPGSGKTHFVKQLVSGLSESEHRIHSTDQYFYHNRHYRFDKSKLETNHKLNQQAFEQSLIAEVPLVICDNTNVKPWQYQPYIDMAFKHGYQVAIKSIGLINTLLDQPDVFQYYQQRNQHQVDEYVYKNMLTTN